jgi:ABC transporter substrate binding protein (PQQ-dependent alcohol dehydrogenase system)
MRAKDYAAWAAVRAIAEAATRAKATVFTEADEIDAAGVRAYLLSEKFQLAAFKGRKMSFRGWNGQLRQPMPLVHPRALVALAPIAGFLHPVTEMDTLGLDRPESKCEVFDK